jgi:hypothetical protein
MTTLLKSFRCLALIRKAVLTPEIDHMFQIENIGNGDEMTAFWAPKPKNTDRLGLRVGSVFGGSRP